MYRDAVGAVTGVPGALSDLAANRGEFEAVLAKAKSMEAPESEGIKACFRLKHTWTALCLHLTRRYVRSSTQTTTCRHWFNRCEYSTQDLQPIEDILDVVSAEQDEMNTG